MTACGLVADPQTEQNKRPACGLAPQFMQISGFPPAVSRNSGKTDRTVYFRQLPAGYYRISDNSSYTPEIIMIIYDIDVNYIINNQFVNPGLKPAPTDWMRIRLYFCL